MLLRLSDLPNGWRADSDKSDDESCAGFDKLTDRYNVLAKADSDDFAQGEATETASSAGIFINEAEAREALNYLEGVVQSDGFRDCLNDNLRKASGEGVAFGDVRVGQVSFPTLGDRSSAWEIVVPFDAQGTSATAYVEAVFILNGNALATVFFSDFFSPFDLELRKQLTRLVASRMDEAADQTP
jgi:hypothetical protein